MELKKLSKLPDNIRPRGRVGALLYDFMSMDAKYAIVIGDDIPRNLTLSLRNEIMKPNSRFRKVRVHTTEDGHVILEKLS